LPLRDSGCAAALRRLAGAHARLIHHYTFEGVTPQARREDKRGSLHLTEAVMQWGRGGDVLYAAPGFDATTRAVRPYRGTIDGNTTGVALQSENTFTPPEQMTVEALVSFAAGRGREESPLACAVATRADDRRCGFFLAAAEQGYLVHLMDADAPWVEGREGFLFLPDEWYYVVSTFAVETGEQMGSGTVSSQARTRVNTYVANLTRGQQTLTWVVRDQLTPGMPAASRLGIGKGFDGNTAHAYPWSGTLDEIAIYDTLLDRKMIEEHLAALVSSRPGP